MRPGVMLVEAFAAVVVVFLIAILWMEPADGPTQRATSAAPMVIGEIPSAADAIAAVCKFGAHRDAIVAETGFLPEAIDDAIAALARHDGDEAMAAAQLMEQGYD